jgi:hypothetical protein
MANKKVGSAFNICKATVPTSTTDANGAVSAGPDREYYFLSSTIYADKEVAKRTGITLIDPTTWEGNEPLIKIDQMLISGKLVRLKGEYTDKIGNNKTVDLLVVRQKVGDIMSDTKSKNLDSQKVLGKAGADKGTFFGVRDSTRTTFA